jgi:hypothetical protein
MKNVITNKYSYLALLCSLLLLSACATTAETKAASIEERASARWNSLLSGDLQGAYEFLSPGFRSSVSSLQYQRSILQNRVQWTAARYIESDCTETACKVKISLGYTLQGGLPGVKSFSGTQTVEESWVLIDGEWYYLPSK